MSPTRQQVATFNAALCLIHDHGHDAAAVTRDAKACLAIGTPAGQAFERTIAAFVARVPSMAAPIKQTANLIAAADERSLAGYNLALTAYLETGDDTQLRGLAPDIATDMMALATRTGEAPPEFSAEMDSIMAGAAAPPDHGSEVSVTLTGEGAQQ